VSDPEGISFVSVERRPDGVAVLRLDNPDQNALSTVVLKQVEDAANELVTDPPGAVILWGGEEIFSQGGDPFEFTSFDS